MLRGKWCWWYRFQENKKQKNRCCVIFFALSIILNRFAKLWWVHTQAVAFAEMIEVVHFPIFAWHVLILRASHHGAEVIIIPLVTIGMPRAQTMPPLTCQPDICPPTDSQDYSRLIRSNYKSWEFTFRSYLQEETILYFEGRYRKCMDGGGKMWGGKWDQKKTHKAETVILVFLAMVW